MASYINLQPGDPAPWFHARTESAARFAFDTAAGRHIVLCFFATAAEPRSRAAIEAALARPDLFNDARASFFGVSVDRSDEAERRIPERTPGCRYFHDHDGGVSRLYGSLPSDARDGQTQARRFWLILDPALRVVAQIPFDADGGSDRAMIGALEAAIARFESPGARADAPVLLLPDVFDRAFCAELIALYEAKGGTDSGFMREVEGKTVGVYDYAHKRRRDYNIDEDAIIKRTQALVRRRIVPAISRAHQFDVTRMERYIVACYDAAEEAHFRPHRDNTTSGTAHRRFACSILLNDDYEGGDLSFPEFGAKRWRPPAGGAVVFSCSLLHTVSRVTKGRRYAFLPFLYDDAAARLREENNANLSDSIAPYRAGRRVKRLIDISPALSAESPVFPGDTAFSSLRVLALDGDCPVNVSKFEATTHIGAHADAPLHYDKNGAPIDVVPLEPYIGPCTVVHCLGRGPVTADGLDAATAGRTNARLLIRTYGVHPGDRWDENFAPIGACAIDWLADRGGVLIGVDTPSLDPATSKSMDAHRRVFAHGLRILEGLVLDHVAPGDYELIAPPLKLKGLDAAPVRAVLRTLL